MKKILMCLFLPILLASCSGDDRNSAPYPSGIPAVSTSAIDFGKTAQYEKSATKLLSISNIGAGNLTFKANIPDDFAFDNSSTCNFSINTLSYGASCNFAIYAETLSSGAVTDNLTITTDNPQYAMIKVSLTADSAVSPTFPVLNYSPDNVTIIDTIRAKPSDITLVSFKNTGTRDLTFTATVEEPFYTDNSSTCSVTMKNKLAPNDSCALAIYVLSQKVGVFTRNLKVKSNDSDKRNPIIPLNANIIE